MMTCSQRNYRSCLPLEVAPALSESNVHSLAVVVSKSGTSQQCYGHRDASREDTGDEFRRYSIAGTAIPTTERFDPIAW
jgi:hypothetical protein